MSTSPAHARNVLPSPSPLVALVVGPHGDRLSPSGRPTEPRATRPASSSSRRTSPRRRPQPRFATSGQGAWLVEHGAVRARRLAAAEPAQGDRAAERPAEHGHSTAPGGSSRRSAPGERPAREFSVVFAHRNRDNYSYVHLDRDAAPAAIYRVRRGHTTRAGRARRHRDPGSRTGCRAPPRRHRRSRSTSDAVGVVPGLRRRDDRSAGRDVPPRRLRELGRPRDPLSATSPSPPRDGHRVDSDSPPTTTPTTPSPSPTAHHRLHLRPAGALWRSRPRRSSPRRSPTRCRVTSSPWPTALHLQGYRRGRSRSAASTTTGPSCSSGQARPRRRSSSRAPAAAIIDGKPGEVGTGTQYGLYLANADHVTVSGSPSPT